jgi:Fe2+ transport system protein FeoA
MQLIVNKEEAGGTLLTLADLDENGAAVVERIELAADLAERLMELGFVPGHRVSVGRAAPGGDPRVFRVDGGEIALRRETSCCIVVRRVEEK